MGLEYVLQIIRNGTERVTSYSGHSQLFNVARIFLVTLKSWLEPGDEATEQAHGTYVAKLCSVTAAWRW